MVDSREALEIGVDHRLRLVGIDLQPLGQTPARDAVENGEVDRLGAGTGVALLTAKQFARGAIVDVLAGGKGLFQRRDIGNMRRQPELDLAIVGSQYDIAGRGHKGLPDLPPDFGADRNILQIGLGRGQASGLRPAQRIGGVNPSGLRVNLLLQRIGIGGFQLRQLPPVDDLLGNRFAVAGQPLEHRNIGRILPRLALLATLEAKLAEQDFTKLLGAADRETLPGQFVDLQFQLGHLLGKGGREPRQLLTVHQHAGCFHPGNHRHQRPVDHLVDPRRPLRHHPQAQNLPEPQRHIRILGTIFGRLVQRHLGKADRLLAGPRQRLEADAFMAEMQFGQFIHTMAMQAGVEVEAHHQRVVKRRDPDIMLGQHAHVIFQILPDLEHRIILEQRFQFRQCLVEPDLLRRLAEHVAAGMTERDIAGLIGAGGQADTDDPGSHAFQAVGLEIDRADTLFGRPDNPLVERRDCLHAFIVRAVNCRGIGQFGNRLGGSAVGYIGILRLGMAIPAQLSEQAVEAVMREKFAQRRVRNILDQETLQRIRQRTIVPERHQDPRQPRLLGIFDQIVAHLRFLHLRRRLQHAFDIAIFVDQL